jgi:Zn-dependent M28 family amino/carboxypeptidase
VIAKLEGDGRADEYVIYTAHWDHLGMDPSLDGDPSSTARWTTHRARPRCWRSRRRSRADHRPDRSILFLAVTAEERGLLGAKYYAENPLYPLERTVANINIDGMNQWGRTEDIVVVGYGATRRWTTCWPRPRPRRTAASWRTRSRRRASTTGPTTSSSPSRACRRSTRRGHAFIGKPAGYGQQKRDEYTANDYHKPSDQVKPDWDLAAPWRTRS